MAVLFDLDGTLVDTAVDLGNALNLLLKRYNKQPIAHELIWPVASHGSKGLLALGFGISPEDSSFEQLKSEYLDLYESVFTRNPHFLPGIEALLDALDARHVPWGIVTNKPRRFSVDLIKSVKMGEHTLFDRAQCLLCGDDAAKPKPSPETLLMASEMMQVKAESCLYLGDAERDVIAGRMAGMKTMVALFGYIAESDHPKEWGADYLIKSPHELLLFI